MLQSVYKWLDAISRHTGRPYMHQPLGAAVAGFSSNSDRFLNNASLILFPFCLQQQQQQTDESGPHRVTKSKWDTFWSYLSSFLSNFLFLFYQFPFPTRETSWLCLSSESVCLVAIWGCWRYRTAQSLSQFTKHLNIFKMGP